MRGIAAAAQDDRSRGPDVVLIQGFQNAVLDEDLAPRAGGACVVRQSQGSRPRLRQRVVSHSKCSVEGYRGTGADRPSLVGGESDAKNECGSSSACGGGDAPCANEDAVGGALIKRLTRCVKSNAVEGKRPIGKVIRGIGTRGIENEVVPVDGNLSWRPATRAIPSIARSTSPCESGRMRRRQHESDAHAAQRGKERSGRAVVWMQARERLKASGGEASCFNFPDCIAGNTATHSRNDKRGVIPFHRAGL